MMIMMEPAGLVRHQKREKKKAGECRPSRSHEHAHARIGQFNNANDFHVSLIE